MCPFIETIRIEDGKIYNINYHTERCNRTRAAFWQDVADIDLGEFISPQSLEGIWKCRIVYGKAIEEITYVPYQRRKVSSLRLVTSDTIDYTYKSTNREELNSLYAQRETADDIDYLLTEYRPKGKQVSNFTLHTYYRILNGALNAAVRAEIIKVNPFTKINNSDKIRLPESKRSYMTIEEVRALIAAPMKNEAVKQAYLFSCFCGLRISDIISLKWKDVFVDRGQYRLAVSMQKTKEPIYLPLSPEALKWMPERGGKSSEDNVFDLPSANTIRMLLKPWAKAAGIDKRFSFHTSRHTFATMMLTLGADLYTTSKLLGHADVKMTQVYAKIINQKKDDAVNLVNGLFD